MKQSFLCRTGGGLEPLCTPEYTAVLKTMGERPLTVSAATDRQDIDM